MLRETLTPPSVEPDCLLEYRENSELLLRNVKSELPALEKLLTDVESDWGAEDAVYRFYHQSFKVYCLQQTTQEICAALQKIFPTRPLNRWFMEIVREGCGHEFELSHNQDWLHHTRAIVEAFFHAHYFLKMCVKYGRELAHAPDRLPSGWAAVLYLFNLR